MNVQLQVLTQILQVLLVLQYFLLIEMKRNYVELGMEPFITMVHRMLANKIRNMLIKE